MRPTLLFLLLNLGWPWAAAAQSCPPARTALVLSGGGAKGLAHIGVLRALDSIGIRPDIVVGSSMGAVIGGLYASGYSGKEIDSLARSLPLSRLFRSYEPRVPLSLGKIQPLIVWEQDDGRMVLQRASVLEPEANALLNAGFLRGNLLARGDFDSLPIPFRAVATDLLSGAPRVLDSGDLAVAVRASAAIPLLFEPERVGGRFLGDGGLSANVPVNIARKAGATRVIVSYTIERRPDSLHLQSPLVMLDYLIGNLFRQPLDSLGPEDLAIRPDIDGFQSLNFSTEAVDLLIRRGSTAAHQALAQAACIPSAHAVTVPHRQLATRIGSLMFDETARADSTYILNTLGLIPGSLLEVRDLQGRLRSLGASSRYSALWLYPSGREDSVVLRFTVHPAPARVVAVTAVYDNDLGGRIWVGQLQRNFPHHDLEVATSASLGERRQEVDAAIRLNSISGGRVSPVVSLELSRELVRRFVEGDEQPALKVHEVQGFAGVETDWRHGWHSALGLEGRWWRESSFRERFAGGPRLSFFKMGLPGETLLNFEASATNEYRRLAIEGVATITLGKLKVRPHGRFGYAESLPEHLQFILGGNDGFAGLHIGEERNSHEAMGSLIVLYPVRGKVFLRVEPMVGATWAGGEVLSTGDVLAGIRVGFDLSTSLGPVRVEYGVGEKGRDALLVRMGRWF